MNYELINAGNPKIINYFYTLIIKSDILDFQDNKFTIELCM